MGPPLVCACIGGGGGRPTLKLSNRGNGPPARASLGQLRREATRRCLRLTFHRQLS